MMNYEAVKAEISLPEYEGLSDAEIAAAMNAQTVPAVQDVPTSTARGLLLMTGEWGAIVLLARQVVALTDPAAPAVVAAITAEDTLRLTETIEATRPATWAAVQQLLAGLVAAGVLSSGTRDALLVMRDTMTSRTAQLGLPSVQACDVQTARLV